MSDLVISGAGYDDEGERKLSIEVFGQMFTRLKFNEHLVKIGFCKKFIKDMTQNEYDDYLRKLFMLQQMSDTAE